MNINVKLTRKIMKTRTPAAVEKADRTALSGTTMVTMRIYSCGGKNVYGSRDGEFKGIG